MWICANSEDRGESDSFLFHHWLGIVKTNNGPVLSQSIDGLLVSQNHHLMRKVERGIGLYFTIIEIDITFFLLVAFQEKKKSLKWMILYKWKFYDENKWICSLKIAV